MAISPVPYDRFGPEYSPAEYSPLDALSFALAAELAYAKTRAGRIDRTRIARQVDRWGFGDVRTFEFRRGKDVDTQGFVGRDARRMLVAFRGSDSGADWRANVQASRDPGPFEKTLVHEGFQDAFFPAVLEIGRAIGRLRDRDQAIWVTGHSLGGALAVLLAATLLENDVPVAGLYTFGAPRVGNRRFEREFNDRFVGASYRVVNQDDVVPHLPPEPFFSHTGDRMLFHNDGRRTSSGSDWKKFRELMWGWIGGIAGSRKIVIKDPHVLASDVGYLRRLLDDLDGA